MGQEEGYLAIATSTALAIITTRMAIVARPGFAFPLGFHFSLPMWNSWITYDPYEMAALCQKDKIRIIGHCKDITPKPNLFDNTVQDIGICAEYEDGEKIWCHASMEALQDMVKLWEKRQARLIKEAQSN